MTAAPTPRRPTIRDVAQVAGVSRGTVSRVLNDERWVSAASRAAVERAIAETGYRVNRNARNLARGPSIAIAFLLTTAQSDLADPVASAVVRGCARALAADGNTLILLLAGTEQERENLHRFLAEGHVDGALTVATGENEALRSAVISAGVPLVVFATASDLAGAATGSVVVDEAAGAREVLGSLLARGRRRIGFVAGPAHSPAAAARLEGFRTALSERGHAAGESLVEVGDWGRKSGVRATRRLLERDGDLDAVIAANDRMAGGALDALREAGLFVPEDVSVAALDGSPLAASLDLTVTSWPLERIGGEMVAMLQAVLAGGEPTALTLAPEFIRRGTT